MSISVENEPLIPLSRVPALPWIPRRRGKSGRLCVSTVWRWAQKGIGGVRLEVVRAGGSLCTSAEALRRFFDRLANPRSQTEGPRNAARATNPLAVERQLDELGVRLADRRVANRARAGSGTK